MSDAAYYREYRKRPNFKEWSAQHEATPARRAARTRANETYRQGHREQISAITLANREQGRAEARAAKSVPCADCGQSFPPCCMDFDHAEGVEKHPRLTYGSTAYRRVPISMTSLAASNLEAFRDEVEKCEVVCANCHRLRTWNRRMGGDHKLARTKA